MALLNVQKRSRPCCFFFPYFDFHVLCATTTCIFSTSQRPKVVQTCGGSTCFYHFHFEMCFTPQPRALFQQLNFQKSSGPNAFSTFYLEMCLIPQRLALFQHIKSRLHLLSSGSFSSLICFLLLFSSFSDCSHPCCFFVHIVGSLTSSSSV